MRISSTNRPDGRHSLSLSPERPEEAVPGLRDLLVDASVLGIPGDRLAAVAALAFEPYLRGVISTERPISPLMARALSTFLDPAFVTPSNISPEGTQFTGSGTTIVLDQGHRGIIGRNRVDRTQVISLDVLPMTTWTGRLFSMDRLVVASNADLIARERELGTRSGPHLAVALAFAHELHVSRIVLPESTGSDPCWVHRATALLAATGVDLVVTSEDSDLHHELIEEGGV